MYSQEEKEIIQQHKRKEMKNLFRNAFTNLSCLEFENIRPSLGVDFGGDGFNFDITVFEKNGNNCTLNFYFFQDLKKIKSNLDGLLKIIKRDEYTQVKNYVDDCNH